MHEGTVIERPRTQLIIERPRLTKLLDEAGARFILLLAPAGYGKTTLAQQWTRPQERVGWYTGGRGMIDVAGLSVGIADVLARMGKPERLDTLERVRILASRGHDARGLAKAVSGGAPGGDWLLVVDDYHHAHGAPDAEAFFEELMSLTEFRLLVTSRERPSWLPARSVVYGESAVVEMDALAFTDEEALQVLGGKGEDVVAEARGWPAVIGLAAMRRGTGVASGLAPEELYRFFAEDLFTSASPELRKAMFLLALAGVECAKSLLGAERVGLLAEATERGFLTGDGRVVHPLLRGFLLAKIGELEEEKIRALVERAVAFLADEHRWDDCLFVLEHFPQEDLILSTLERGLAEILDAGRVATVQDWLSLAQHRKLEDALLVLAEAEIAVRDRQDLKAQALGERAGAMLEGDLAARAFLAAARAAHLRSSPVEAHRLADLALTIPGISEALRNEALWAKFNCTREETNSDALAILERLQSSTSRDPSHQLRLLYARGVVLCDSGRIAEGVGAMELAAASVSEAHDPFARTGVLHFLAYTYLLAAQYADALIVSSREIEEGRDSGLLFVADHGVLALARANIGLRRLVDARGAIEQLRRRQRELSSFVRGNLVLHDVRLAMTAGDLERAQALLPYDLGPDERPAFRGEIAAFSSIIAASRGQIELAERQLNLDEDCFRFVEASALRAVARAIISLRRGEAADQSVHQLRGSLVHGVADALVMGIRAYPDLASALANDDPGIRAALTNILTSSHDFDIARRAGLQLAREARPRERLSRREREVYELLAQGRSNAEIAGVLFISESTTKVHVRHIFEKLGVHTRAEAASLASELAAG